MRGVLLWMLLVPAVLAAPGCAGPRPSPPGAGHGAPLVGSAASPAAAGPPEGPLRSRALAASAVVTLDTLVPRLAEYRVVYVGETHDRYEHHLNQLEVIRRLHARHPDLAIGMEYFQRPFQVYLDQYVAGQLDEQGMLRKTDYYQRWRFDYRLYRPILRYARERRIPLIALNVPEELTRRVASVGMEGLTAAERAQLPAPIDRSDEAYRERLRAVFEQHPAISNRTLDRFVDAQLTWDEGMAQSAAEYLRAHPQAHLVVLAGSGHLAYGSGIPKRLQRRLGVRGAILLNDPDLEWDPAMADYLLFPEPRDLPPAVQLGVLLGRTGAGVTVTAVAPGSAAETAGMKVGDRLLRLDGEVVANPGDVKVSLLDRRPGDRLLAQVQRHTWWGGEQDRALQITLR